MFTSARKLVINVSIVRREPSSLLKGCNGFPVFAKPVVSRAEKEKGPRVVRNQCCSLPEQGKGFGVLGNRCCALRGKGKGLGVSVGPKIAGAQPDQTRGFLGTEGDRWVYP